MITRPTSLVALGLLLLAPTLHAQTLPHVWSQSFGDSHEDRVRSVTVDDSGNIIIAGYFNGNLNFGGDWLYSLGDFDIFLAKFTPDGDHLWSRSFGSYDNQCALSVDVISSGHILLGGYFANRVDFGGGLHLSAGGYDAFVAKFTPDGAYFWSRTFGDEDFDYCRAVSHGNGGMTYLVGDFLGSINLGGSPLSSAGGSDLWVAVLDGSGGNHMWSQRYGDDDEQFAYGIAGHPQGPVAITGYTYGDIDFGGGLLPCAGGPDVFVASFDFYGAHRWSRVMGDASGQYGIDVAFHDSPGAVVASGQFLGTLDLGGGPLTSGGSVDAYLAKYDANGTHLWSQRFGGTQAAYARGVSVDMWGNIALTGFFEGTAQFGGAPLTSAGDFDAVVATYGADGSHNSSQHAGDAAEQNGLDIFYEDDGQITTVGKFEGSIDLGGGPLVSNGDCDLYVAKFGSSSGIATDSPTSPRVQFLALPSPVTSAATIAYTLSQPGIVRLDVHDAQGRLLGTLVDGYRAAGVHTAAWAPRDVATWPVSSGVLLVRLASGPDVQVSQVVVVR